MHISPHDPTGSFRSWSRTSTAHARNAGEWTAEDDLFVDYHQHAEAQGLAPSERLTRDAFRAELRILCGRMAEDRRVRAIGASFPRTLPCWPRTLTRPLATRYAGTDTLARIEAATDGRKPRRRAA